MGLSSRLAVGAADLGDRTDRRPDAGARFVHPRCLRTADAVPDHHQFRAVPRRPLLLEQTRARIYDDVADRDDLLPHPRRRSLFARPPDWLAILGRQACHLSTPMA